jgi:hypothetical protein
MFNHDSEYSKSQSFHYDARSPGLASSFIQKTGAADSKYDLVHSHEDVHVEAVDPAKV